MTLNKKLFLTIWLAGTLSALAVFPYVFDLQKNAVQSSPLSLPVLALLSLLKTTLLLAVATSLGLFFARRVGFKFPLLEKLFIQTDATIRLRNVVAVPVVLGILTVIVVTFGDWLFTIAGVVMDAGHVTPIPIWFRFLAPFYGGIGEEILTRLFLVSMFVWIFGKITRSQAPLSRSGLVWSAIAIAAIIFGLLHLPVTSVVTQLTPLVIARVTMLNGILGLVFGWLYWKKGFEAAVIAHFTADIMILIVLPAIIGW